MIKTKFINAIVVYNLQPIIDRNVPFDPVNIDSTLMIYKKKNRNSQGSSR